LRADKRALVPAAEVMCRIQRERKPVVFGAARAYTVTVPGSTWKSWFNGAPVLRPRKSVQICTSKVLEVLCFNGAAVFRPRKLGVPDPAGNGPQNLNSKTHARYEETIGNLGTPSAPPWRHPKPAPIHGFLDTPAGFV
jgi:hypothetical protein